MTPDLPRDARTAIRLFQVLEADGIGYAILRNYDQYPHFGHDIDLTTALQDIPRLRALLIDLALEDEWDALVECDHWNKSSDVHHNIHIFKFFKADPFAFLQIDVFQALLVLGIPIYDSNDILAAKVRSDKGFFHLNRTVENLFRALQIHRLGDNQAAQEKIGRYKDQVIAFARLQGESYRKEIADRLGPIGLAAVEALLVDDIQRFRRLMSTAKATFFMRKLAAAPIIALQIGLSRTRDYVHSYFLRQCGFTVSVLVPDEQAKTRVKEALKLLGDANIVYSWTAGEASRCTITWGERRVMERGGLVIKWTDSPNADLTVMPGQDKFSIANQLIDLLVERHEILYRRVLG
jgi:hypothetical protein